MANAVVSFWLTNTDNGGSIDYNSSLRWRLIRMWHASFICDMPHLCVTRLFHMWRDPITCPMTHSYVTCLIHMRHASSLNKHGRWCCIRVWRDDSFICDMTHLCVTCLIHTWHDLFLMWHDSSIDKHGQCAVFVSEVMTHSCVTFLIHTWHDSFFMSHHSSIDQHAQRWSIGV